MTSKEKLIGLFLNQIRDVRYQNSKRYHSPSNYDKNNSLEAIRSTYSVKGQSTTSTVNEELINAIKVLEPRYSISTHFFKPIVGVHILPNIILFKPSPSSNSNPFNQELEQLVKVIKSIKFFRCSTPEIVDTIVNTKCIYLQSDGFKFVFINQSDPSNKQFCETIVDLHSSLETGFPCDKFKDQINKHFQPPSTIMEAITIALASLSMPFVKLLKTPHQVGIEILCSCYIKYTIDQPNGSFDNFESNLKMDVPQWCFDYLKFLFGFQLNHIDLPPVYHDIETYVIRLLPPAATTHSFLLTLDENINYGQKQLPLPLLPSDGRILNDSRDVGEYLALYDTLDVEVNSNMVGTWLLFTKFNDTITDMNPTEVVRNHLRPSIDNVGLFKVIDISEWVKSFKNQSRPKRMIDKNKCFYFRQNHKKLHDVVKQPLASTEPTRSISTRLKSTPEPSTKTTTTTTTTASSKSPAKSSKGSKSKLQKEAYESEEDHEDSSEEGQPKSKKRTKLIESESESESKSEEEQSKPRKRSKVEDSSEEQQQSNSRASSNIKKKSTPTTKTVRKSAKDSLPLCITCQSSKSVALNNPYCSVQCAPSDDKSVVARCKMCKEKILRCTNFGKCCERCHKSKVKKGYNNKFRSKSNN